MSDQINWKHNLITLGIAIIAGLIINYVTYLVSKNEGIEIGIKRANQAYIQKTESAPTLYTNRLGEMIYNADPMKSKDLIVDARAIVSTRDDYRGSLIAISKLLNSEIDRLKEEVEKADNALRQGQSYDRSEIERTLGVLQKKWPSKKEQIIVEVRKLLAELGIEPVDLIAK